jgi:sigma-E factor negative regulatory protein RseB
MNRGAFLWALIVLLSAVPGAAFAGGDVYQKLERMGAAMSHMTYQGTFVYVSGDNVESMRVTHVVDEHGIRERIISVSGSQGELVRDSDGVRWTSGAEGTVMADTASNRGFFPDLPLGDALRESDAYELKMGGKLKIAGHVGQKLSIVPVDQYRYGYNLWQEIQSGMLLRWELTDSNGKVLSKLIFTELKMGSEVDAEELGVASSKGSMMPGIAADEPGRHTIQLLPKWQPEKIPVGFRLASHRFQKTGKLSSLEHLVYSDGIAAVSIYVETGQDKPELDSGLSKMGATHFFTRVEGSENITVLGDVPAVTVELIGESLRLSRP